MDINRYYVPPNQSQLYRASRDLSSSSNNVNSSSTSKLPTPAAFFERQARFRQADKKAMLRFAKKKTVKHNLKLRHSELKSIQNDLVNEVNQRLKQKVVKNVDHQNLSETDKEDRALRREYLIRKLNESKKGGTGNGGAEYEGFLLSELEEALDNEDEVKINRAVLVNFFEVVDPSRVAEVDDLLEKNKGNEYKLFDSIAKDYNVIRTPTASASYSPTRNLRKSIANIKSTLKKVSSFRTLKGFDNEKFGTLKHQSSFTSVEIPKPENLNQDMQTNNNNELTSNTNVGKKDPEQRLRRIDSTASGVSVTFGDNDQKLESKDVVEFEGALNDEIKSKMYTGEYVTSIIEHGGRWWVNRDPPKVHASQRRRKTLLDELANGNLPIL